MKTIIIPVLLLILGFYSIYRVIKEDNKYNSNFKIFTIFTIIGVLSFASAMLYPLITKNRYVYNVTVIAQDGQEYNYEECYIEQDRTKIIIRFKNEEPVIFYTPIKVDQRKNEKNAD